MTSLTFKLSLLLICVAIFGSSSNKNVVKAAIDCPSIINEVKPCYDFLIRQVPEPSSTCCTSISSFVELLKASKEDQRAVCECLKEAAEKYHIDVIKVVDLAQECHLISSTLGPNDATIDCSLI